jgi:hypothetical protein
MEQLKCCNRKKIINILKKLKIKIIARLPKSKSGEATNNKIPKPAKIPITCALCHTTDARE